MDDEYLKRDDVLEILFTSFVTAKTREQKESAAFAYCIIREL